MNLAELFHHDMARARIEVAGWLIGKNNFRMIDEGTGDTDALLLAARKLIGKEIFAFFQMESGEHFGSAFQTASFAHARINQRKGDIFDDREIIDKVEVLENVSDFARAESGFFA